MVKFRNIKYKTSKSSNYIDINVMVIPNYLNFDS